MSKSLVVGNKVCLLMLVEINSADDVAKGKAKQSNKFYNMYEQSNGTFIVEFGRVNSSMQTKVYPMSKWDSVIAAKTKPSKGYKDVTHLFADDSAPSTSQSDPIGNIGDTNVRRIVTQLQNYASTSVKKNYSVSSTTVTTAMVNEAQSLVDLISKSIKELASPTIINNHLMDLYHVIPRKMGNVRDYLLDDASPLSDPISLEKASKLLEEEQSTLDVMSGQVGVNTKPTSGGNDNLTLLDMIGVTMSPATNDDISMIKHLLGPNANRFKSAFAVHHNHTKPRFDASVSNATDKTTQLFWHGSRNQNWLNILSTGLLIRPSGAIHTGSMFGDGIYFSNVSQKSIGYTSLRGSYWTGGSDTVAYVALFKVHVGNQKHIYRHDRSCYSLSETIMTQQGYDSVYAHGGADLRNDEFIIYNAIQCTVSYLVEIG